MHRILAVMVLQVAMVAPGLARTKGTIAPPATPEARKVAIQMARALESDPKGPDAPAYRAFLSNWLDRLEYSTCVSLLSPLLKNDDDFSRSIFMQMMYSGGAFVLEDPVRSRDERAVWLAGLSGALDAYSSWIRQDSSARLSFLDDLVAKRASGTLAEYVNQHDCSSK